MKAGHRNRWFIMFTNVQIDIGFIPMILVLITTENHLRVAWRFSLGLGVIPLSLFYLRLKLKEPEEFKRETMKDTKLPMWLIIKIYWFRLTIVSLIWFIYDFSAYSFGIYSSEWISLILGKDSCSWKSFGWNTLVNVFYLPGAIGGVFLSDMIGPRLCLGIGVLCQGIVGFIMSGAYGQLATSQHVAGFVVVYGIFLSLGELGPGDNIGLVASKTSHSHPWAILCHRCSYRKGWCFRRNLCLPNHSEECSRRQIQYPRRARSVFRQFEFVHLQCLPSILLTAAHWAGYDHERRCQIQGVS